MGRPASYVTEALVLRVIAFGETSQVLHLATPERGLVAALAKGAYRPDSEVQGGLSLLALGEATLKATAGRASSEGLDLLLRFRQRDLWRGLVRAGERYRAAAHVLELLRLWMRPQLPAPALYGAGVTVLRALASSPLDHLGAWIIWFEARATSAAGHRPSLETCAACGQAISGTLAFDPAAGGVVHRRCVAGATAGPLTPSAYRALEHIYTARLADFVAEPLAPSAVRAVREVHDRWLPWVLERRLTALESLPRP